MKFGRTHSVLTTALAALGIVALMGSVPLPGVAPVQIVVELLLVTQLVALVFRRGARHDSIVFVLALVHFLAATIFGGGLVFLLSFVGVAVVLPAALVLSHLRREVEANYHQGARDRTGLPVDVPRILRSRRVMGQSSLVALGSLSLPILAVTALLFLLLPRLGLAPRTSWLSELAFDPRAGLLHFTDSVDLGQRGDLRPNPAVALRFRVADVAEPPARMPLRFRGAVQEQFDGRTWTRASGPASLPPSLALTSPPPGRAVTIEREPFEPAMLFVPSGAMAVRALDAPDDGALPRRYVAYLAAERGQESAMLQDPLSAAERARDLALPPALPARVAELAHAWSDGEPTAEGKARAIEQHLAKDLAYDLASAARGSAQPVDNFLFESKRGHCELFASALAMMLRSIGIPARNVTGLLGGTYNRFGGYYVVRQGEAHAWVEAYVDGGWRTFDPTPTSLPAGPETGVVAGARDLGDAFSRRWGSDIVMYDRHTQSAIIDAVRAPLVIAAAILVPLLVVLAVRRNVPRRSSARGSASAIEGGAAVDREAGAATELYGSLENALVAQGIVRERSMPPLAHAEHLAREHHPLANVVIDLTRLYLEARFGGRPLTGAARRDFERGISLVAAWQRA